MKRAPVRMLFTICLPSLKSHKQCPGTYKDGTVRAVCTCACHKSTRPKVRDWNVVALQKRKAGPHKDTRRKLREKAAKKDAERSS